MKKILFVIIFCLLAGGLATAKLEMTTGNENMETGAIQAGGKDKIIKEVAPEFDFIYPKEGTKMEGQVEIKGRVKSALSVELYLKYLQSSLPIYLSRANSLGKNLWVFTFDTKSVPNGDYQLFARITNEYGEYESQRVNIKIENQILREKEKENTLREEIRKAEEEIKKEEESIGEKKEEVKEKITEQSSQEVKEVLEQNVDKLGEVVRQEVETAKEIQKKEAGKIEIENKIEPLQKEIEKTKEIKEKLPEGTKKEEAKIVEEINTENLAGFLKDKEETEKELSSLKEKSEVNKAEKEKIKAEIIKNVPEAKKAEVKTLVGELENAMAENEETKIEKSRVLLKDSDNDGLADKEEVRLGTSPFNPDSDSDGFLDEVEVKTGYDPLKAGPADKIIYQDPKKVPPKKSEVYQVEKVEKVTLTAGEAGLKFSGKGLPNSFITLFIFSTPIVVAVKTNENGYWEYTLDKPLVDGEHRVYATLTSNQGEIEARSETFVFVKTGEKIFRIFEAPAQALSPLQVLEKPFVILIIAIIILALGIALVIISVLTKKKTEENRNV